MEHELPKILDGADEPVTVEELEGVVQRAAQRRRARLAGGAIAMLSVGAVLGGLARQPAEGPAGFAADLPPVPGKPEAAIAMDGFGGHPGGPLTPLFRRDANGVAIRAYRLGSPPTADTPCDPKPLVQAQLSNGAAVTVGLVPDLAGDTFGVLGYGTLGTVEGEPATWVAVRAGTGVSTVRLTAGAATDAMAPQNGIAVLVVPGGDVAGTVDAIGADGAVTATASSTSFVDSSFAYGAPDPACVPKDCMFIEGPPPTTVPGQDPVKGVPEGCATKPPNPGSWPEGAPPAPGGTVVAPDAPAKPTTGPSATTTTAASPSTATPGAGPSATTTSPGSPSTPSPNATP